MFDLIELSIIAWFTVIGPANLVKFVQGPVLRVTTRSTSTSIDFPRELFVINAAALGWPRDKG